MISLPWKVGWAFLLAELAVVVRAFGGMTPPFTVMIPMRDGVRLAADVYLPAGGGSVPVILTRTPYDRRYDSVDPLWIDDVLWHGYGYVVQDTRGRHASQGADSTFWTDGWGALQDGYDTVEWIASQSFCDGNVGMHGWSARGVVQYRAAGAAPPHLRACMATIACEDFYEHAFFPGGELQYDLVRGWYERQHCEALLPFFLSHASRDEFWDALDLETRAGVTTVPILHVGGHFDAFGEAAIDAFRMLEEQGGAGAAGNQRLVLGPWTHDGVSEREQGEILFPPNAYYDLRTLTWRWFDHWLKGVENGVMDELPVEVYLMGDVDDPEGAGNEWLSFPEYPPETSELSLFLQPFGSGSEGLGAIVPPFTGAARSWSSNPAAPVVTRGGRNLFLDQGPFDQRVVHDGRADVLRFATLPLPGPIVVIGKVLAELFATSTALDADFCAKLIDVYPDGREMLVTEGILRARFRRGFEADVLIEPGTVDRYLIDLWSTAHAFGAGHRIMLALSSTNWPHFAINPQNGNPFGGGGPLLTAVMTVRTDLEHPSRLILPVYGGGALSAGASETAPSPLVFVVERNPASAFRLRILNPVGGYGEMFSGRGQRAWASVYAADGRFIRALGARSSSVLDWDGTSEAGLPVPGGVYFVRAGLSGVKATTRLVLVR